MIFNEEDILINLVFKEKKFFVTAWSEMDNPAMHMDKKKNCRSS